MIYKIKKGKHYSGWRFPRFHSKIEKLEFTVIFDKSCLYKFNDVDDLDISKIYGISWGYHHDNSLRIGYNINWDFGKPKIALYTYSYCDSIRDFKYIASCDFDTSVQIKIQFDYNNNVIFINLNPVYLENHLTKRIFFKLPYLFPKFLVGYRLYYFFGGNKKAPHDMKITILEN